MENLRVIVLDNFKGVGDKIIEKLGGKQFSIEYTNPRFSNGEGKAVITGTVRGKDVFILSDVGNYGVTYKMHGMDIPMSPDEHFQDIKRVIGAMSGQANRVTVVMPLLYESRQDKRKGKESLDCAIALQELEKLGVNQIVTLDCHNPNVCNAIPNLPFQNIYPSNTILKDFIANENTDDLLVISPDMGGMERARYFAEMLGVDVGVFYKRRDQSRVVDGKNPILEHTYMGTPVNGKNCIVVDDMIASGGSMIEVGERLKCDGANEVTFVASFGLFTEGMEKFDKAYEAGVFDKLYTTNLTYIPEEFQTRPYLHVVDCSEQLADIVTSLHKDESIKRLLNGKEEIFEMLEEKRQKGKVRAREFKPTHKPAENKE